MASGSQSDTRSARKAAVQKVRLFSDFSPLSEPQPPQVRGLLGGVSAIARGDGSNAKDLGRPLPPATLRPLSVAAEGPVDGEGPPGAAEAGRNRALRGASPSSPHFQNR